MKKNSKKLYLKFTFAHLIAREQIFQTEVLAREIQEGEILIGARIEVEVLADTRIEAEIMAEEIQEIKGIIEVGVIGGEVILVQV